METRNLKEGIGTPFCPCVKAMIGAICAQNSYHVIHHAVAIICVCFKSMQLKLVKAQLRKISEDTITHPIPDSKIMATEDSPIKFC